MKRFVVTIGREYGSGGRLIGKQLAQELGVPFYDKELIALTAQRSGLSEAFVEESAYKKTKGILYGGLYITSKELPITDQIFIAQTQVIQKIAWEESAVIVGRCGDYALRGSENCFRVFIHAPIQERMRRVREQYGVEDENLEAHVRREDKKRASYYTHFTDQKWGDVYNYHLCVDSSVGLEKSVGLIKQLVRSED